MAVPRQLWSLLWRMPMQPWNEGKQSAVRDTLGGADWTELKNSWITLFMWGDHANVCKCMVNLQDFTLKNVFFGLVMDPCWNIYVDFWARSSRLVFNESVCEIFNINQYFAVLQKWPNRCLPQKVVGVLGPEFQSSQFFFGRYFLSTPPNNKSSTKSRSSNSMVFHAVAQIFGQFFRSDPSPWNFWSLKWVKRIGFQKRPQTMAPKTKQTFEFQVKCPEWFGAKGLSDIISQECWVQCECFCSLLGYCF